ncbi:MAG: D-alanyl-D-alanine carboxypeptidase [Patescibacteria group bacterium]|nr:D-alanyl-D-alanine carboxypeptidase [Patescibacteria group bacterium]
MKNVKRKLDFSRFLTEFKENKERYLIFCFFFLLLLLIPGQSYYQTLTLISQEKKFLDLPFLVPLPAPYPQKTAKMNAPQISALSAIIMDVDSQVVMYSKNPREKLLPASTTKIMTALVALNRWQPEDVLPVPLAATQKADATDSALMGLVGGEKLTLKSLLYGLLLNSGGDAAYTLSMDYEGSRSGFIKAMNQKVEQLHLTDTKYQNEIGFDDSNQQTSVLDLARLATLALKNPLFSQIVATKNVTVSDESKTHWYHLQNLNELLWEEPGAEGVKTGFTNDAGECLVAEVKRNGHRVLTVVLKSSDRFGDSKKLINWAFANFSWVTLPANR